MVTQTVKKLIISTFSLLFFSKIIAQVNHCAPLMISTNVSKHSYYPGDTIIFTIKNLTKERRFYRVESLINNSVQIEQVNKEILNAYFNKDTAFFEHLEKNIVASKKSKLGYIMPDVHSYAYAIEGDSSATYGFVVKGKTSKQGIKMSLRINPDVVAGEGKNLIETKSFWLYVDLRVEEYKNFL